MVSYTLGQIKLSQLQELVELEDRGVLPEVWDQRELGQLSAEEKTMLGIIRKHMASYKTHLVNEATLWARAIYPLLLLAERDFIRAFSLVPLSATLPRAELRGEVDGALAHMGIEGDAAAPYLLIVKAKRGIEGHEPVAQLIAGLLCAAWHNHRRRPQAEHRLYGAYTIADVWTFLQVTFRDLDGERPACALVFSGEYAEKTEAETILLLLKSMVAELR
jgi:hypothetical protein